ncbi:AAA family ATPase [Nocardiopsis flavescens]|uniref:AAA family ATPase n=1 Tax=Nocardiopsis flavescens TaxID=758803 RepID=UPI0009FE72F6
MGYSLVHRSEFPASFSVCDYSGAEGIGGRPFSSLWASVCISSVRVQNFRRLRSVKVDLDKDATVFVGANNSGKASMIHVFCFFFGR